MTIIEISQRIATLTDAHRECMVLISRLSKLGGSGTDAARLELATVIHQSLKDAEQELELIATQVDDEVNENSSDGAALKIKLNKLTEDMKIARLQYRKAQLAAKRTSETVAQKERESLLGSSGRSTPDGKRRVKQQNMSQNDLLVNASTDVTVALRRTHTLLQSELSRSQFATETLNESTAALQDLSARYSAFDDIVSRSRELVIELIRKNKSDRWYYEKAIQLLVGMLIWILIRRLIWGPIWLFIGLPFNLVWWSLSVVARGMGVGGDGGLAEISMGADGIERVAGGTATVEVKGIPESMLERRPEVMATRSVAGEAPEPVVTEQPMKEKVERIIDGEEDVVMVDQSEDKRATESRKPEDASTEEQTAQADTRTPKLRQVEYAPAEGHETQEEARNTKSRRVEYDSMEQASILEEPATEVTDAKVAVEDIRDEL